MLNIFILIIYTTFHDLSPTTPTTIEKVKIKKIIKYLEKIKKKHLTWLSVSGVFLI